MRKLLQLIACLCVLASPVAAQVGGQATPVRSGATDPATCDPTKGSLFFNTSTNPGTLKTCTATNTWSAPSSAATAQGPVINVTNPAYAGGASSSNADNNAQFTAAVAAAVAATNPGVSSSGVGTPVSGSIQNGTVTTNLSITIPAGNTNFAILTDGVSSQPFTITDSGGSVYSQISRVSSSGAIGSIRIFATAAGAAKASTTVTATNNGSGESLNLLVVSYPNVTAFKNPQATTAATTSSLSVSQSTTRAFGSILVGCQFFNSNVASFSATTGTLRTSLNSAVGTAGALAMDNSSGPLASVTNAGTFSATTNRNCINIELQSNAASNQIPTVYVPAGYYYYSGGLSLTVPMLLKGEAGSVLCYTGNAHAVDVGPAGLNAATASSYPYFIDGLEFNCGGSATQGIFLNQAIVIGGIRNTNFRNFGPPSVNSSSGWMIASAGQNWDWEVGPQVHVWTTDGIPRNFLRSNLNAVDEFSFFRIHNIEMYCYLGTFVGNSQSCSTQQAGIGMWLDSHQNIVDGNSLAFFNPDIVLACTAGPCYTQRIEHNIITAPTLGGTTACKSPLSLQGQQQASNIHDNIFEMNGCSTTSPIGPWDGSFTLQSSRVNFNQADLLSAATPFVALNNLTGQTSNQSIYNVCNTAQGTGTFAPCPILHTAGANIAQWSNDYYIALTFSAATSVSYTFSQTYSTHPKCTISPIIPGATTFSISTLSTTTLTVTASGAFTGEVDAVCSAGDAQ